MKHSHECINDFTKMQDKWLGKWLGDKADTQKIGCPRLLSIIQVMNIQNIHLIFFSFIKLQNYVLIYIKHNF